MSDEYPSGTNAVVAVIAYTGYDMDDAMIRTLSFLLGVLTARTITSANRIVAVNKASVERGFAHGSVYKSLFVDVSEGTKAEQPATSRIGNIVQQQGQLS